MTYVAIPEQFRGDYLKDVVRREKESREQLMQVRGKSRNPHVRIGGFVKLNHMVMRAFSGTCYAEPQS